MCLSDTQPAPASSRNSQNNNSSFQVLYGDLLRLFLSLDFCTAVPSAYSAVSNLTERCPAHSEPCETSDLSDSP